MPLSPINKGNLDSLVASAKTLYRDFAEGLSRYRNTQVQSSLDYSDDQRTEQLINSLHQGVEKLTARIDSIFRLNAKIIAPGMGWGSIDTVIFNNKIKQLRDLIKAWRFLFATLLNGNTHPNQKVEALSAAIKSNPYLYYKVMISYRDFMEMSIKLDQGILTFIDKWLDKESPISFSRENGLI